MSNDSEEFSDAWRELAGAMTQNKVDSFFDESFKEIHDFYNNIGQPKGSREEEFWEWVKEELFNARKRSLIRQENVIRALEDSLKNKFK